MKKILLILCILFIVVSTMSYAYTNEQKVILYKIGDNDTTVAVNKNEVESYTWNYEWSIEPTTLMYTEDGRKSWIWNSEIEKYTLNGWSVNEPITLYGINGITRLAFPENKQNYLNSGYWFNTYEEANPAVFTYNVFQKSNLSVTQLNKILVGTGLEGFGQAFYDMEQIYGVNSLFCIAVGSHESANFYKKVNTNNFFGFKGNKSWMSFNTPEDCIMYFGQLMNEKIYYGKSIELIAINYCDSSWVRYIKQHMIEKWKKL